MNKKAIVIVMFLMLVLTSFLIVTGESKTKTKGLSYITTNYAT
jgi:hypothetical protein